MEPDYTPADPRGPPPLLLSLTIRLMGLKDQGESAGGCGFPITLPFTRYLFFRFFKR